MKKAELFSLVSGINAVSKVSGKFAYALARNKRDLLAECALIEGTIAPTDEFKAFQQQCNDLVIKFSGPPVNDMYQVTPENNAAFQTEYAELHASNQEVVDARFKLEQEYRDLLQTDTDFQVFKISPDLIPEDLNEEQISGILALIED